MSSWSATPQGLNANVVEKISSRFFFFSRKNRNICFFFYPSIWTNLPSFGGRSCIFIHIEGLVILTYDILFKTSRLLRANQRRDIATQKQVDR